jgi:hypothetical protein
MMDQQLHTGVSHMQSITRSFGVGTWKKNIVWNFSRISSLSARSCQPFFSYYYSIVLVADEVPTEGYDLLFSSESSMATWLKCSDIAINSFLK